MSETATLEQRGPVFILNLGETENRFNFDSIAHLNSLLDQVDAAPGDKTLVTIADGKFWSNGLDLDWMIANNVDLAALDLLVVAAINTRRDSRIGLRQTGRPARTLHIQTDLTSECSRIHRRIFVNYRAQTNVA